MAHERTASVGAYGAADADAPVMVKRVSWGAILAGLVIILVIQLLFSLLGIGIGASTIDPAQGQSPQVSSFGIGAGIWWVVTALVSVGIGAWVAGRLAGRPTRLDGALHGIAAWGLSALVVFWLMTTAMSSLIGGAFSVVGSAVQSAGQAVVQGGQAVANTDVQLPGRLGQIQNRVEQQITQLMNQGGQQAQQTGQQIQQAASDPQVRALVMKMVTAGPDGLSQNDRNAAIEAVVQNTSLTRQEVEQRLQQMQQAYQQAMQEARQAAEVAANTLSQAAIWSFIALVVGAVIGAVGGAVGAPRDLRAAGYR